MYNLINKKDQKRGVIVPTPKINIITMAEKCNAFKTLKIIKKKKKA